MSKTLSLLALFFSVLVAGAPVAHAGIFTYSPTSSSWFIRLLGPSIALAGRDLNGTDLNGRVLDGHYVEGVYYAGATRNGSPAGNVWLQRSRIQGIGGLYNGQAEARLVAELDDGSTLTLRIDSAARHDASVHHDVFLYTVSYETAQGWLPVCGNDAESGEPVPAIALEGRWVYEEGVADGGAHIDDPNVFTFGCVNRAIGKCVLAGYKPWRQALSCNAADGCTHISLADHHQACTRALRADYCGDGVSHTEDGMVINFYDAMNVRVDAVGWPVEAEWDTGGARCAVAERLDAATPWCMQSLYDPSCGQWDAFGSGTLLITEYDAPLAD